MVKIVAALTAQQAELAGLVDGLDEGQLATPSACEGWSIADVLLHLAQTNEMAIASVAGELLEASARLAGDIAPVGSVDEWADAVVAHERGGPLLAVRERWAASAAGQEAAFANCDPKERLLWVAGDMAARTLATTRLTETWIHTNDIAVGLGIDLPPTDRLWHTARLSWRTLPYAFIQAGQELSGPVVFDLVAPDGSKWLFDNRTFEDLQPPLAARITGDAVDLCMVAGQRVPAAATGLVGEGPQADAVLDLVRTFA